MPLSLGFIGREAIWLLPVLPSISFLLLVFWRRHFPNEGASISIGAIACAFLISISILLDFQTNGAGHQTATWFQTSTFIVTIGFTADSLSVIMIGLITLVSLCVQIYSLGYMKGEERIGLYYAYHSLFAASMLILVLANSFLLLYFGWELVGLCSFLLINFHFERPAATNAAKKAFLVNRVGDIGMFLGIMTFYFTCGSFNYMDIGSAAMMIGSSSIITIAGLLVFMGAVGKSAQLPLHVWLPDAMEGPTPVSALIHAATMVAAGVYMTLRIFPFLTLEALSVIAFIGAITALIASLIATSQNDIKKILAYSTVSQLGYMMLALGVGAYGPAIFHLVTHAFFKSLLFLGAGSVNHATDTNDMNNMGGLRKKMPITHLTFVIGAFSLVGIFPLSGFWSKDEILAYALHANTGISLIVFILGTLAAIATACYVTRMMWMTFYPAWVFRGADTCLLMSMKIFCRISWLKPEKF